MPETGKLLQFRRPEQRAARTREEVSSAARAFLEVAKSDRTAEYKNTLLADSDVLTTILYSLRDVINTDPALVLEEALDVYRWLSARSESDFFFDERDYFMGEAALLVGGGSRHLGKRSEADSWFDRSDASFRHTVAPAAHLARVSYERLALRYDQNRHEEVLDLLPSTALTFRKLGMARELEKCVFLEAMSLKMLGRCDEAATRFESLASVESVSSALRGTALMNLGNLYSSQGAFDRALAAYRDARPLLEAEHRSFALADLKAMLGETLRSVGRIGESLVAYREAISDMHNLGMVTRVAYFRIALAEALLEAKLPREAEWEILAALPTIDDQSMVPEGFTAISLLRESIRHRKTDPQALLELRQYLQANG